MKKSILTLLIPVILGFLVISCNKPDEAPKPVINKIKIGSRIDTFYVKSDSLVCNVMANDTNPNKADHFAYTYTDTPNFKFKVNKDSTITCIRLNKNYIGWAYIQYNLSLANDGTGKPINITEHVRIRIGTDAQWIAKKFIENPKYQYMGMFAVDGDTSIRRKWEFGVTSTFSSYNKGEIFFADMNKEKSIFFSIRTWVIDDSGVMSGNFDGSTTLAQFKILGEYKSKGIDKSGKTIDVSGLSFYFLGRQHDYVVEYSQLKYN